MDSKVSDFAELAATEPFALYARRAGERVQLWSTFEHVARSRAVPSAKWNADDRCWEVPASAAGMRDVTLAFAGVGVQIADDLADLLGLAEVQAEARSARDATEQPDHPSKLPSWTHQRAGYEFLTRLEAGLLLMEMGTGKSKVIVDMVVNRGFRRTLIVAPRRALKVWPREFAAFAAGPVKVIELEGLSTAQRVKAVKAATTERGPVAVVVNYEGMWRQPLLDALIQAGFDCLVFDEIHKIKGKDGKASQAAAALGKAIPHRYGLTGTPMPHDPFDVWSQYRAIDPGIFGDQESDFMRFRFRYGTYADATVYVPGGRGQTRRIKQLTGYQRQDELSDRMYQIAYRVQARDVLDLPPTQWLPVEFDMPATGQRLYDAVEGEYARLLARRRGDDGDWAEDDDDRDGECPVTITNPLTELLRLEQIVNGSLTMDDGRAMAVESGKEAALLDLVEDIADDQPVVVGCRFTADLEACKRVAAATGRTYGEISGRRSDLDDRAHMPAGIGLMAVNIQSGGVGVDLTQSHHCVLYGVGFNNGDFDQFLRRTDRPGQTESVRYYPLVARNTVDQTKYQALREKRDVAAAVVDFLRRRHEKVPNVRKNQGSH